MSEQTIVLGSGASALAYLFYHPQAIALAGKNVGGMFKCNPDFGPQYLWVDKYAEQLLNDLKLPCTRKTIHVGISMGDCVLRPELGYCEDLKLIMKMYAQKTRGAKAQNSFMSGGKFTYEVYCVTLQEIVDTLLSKTVKRLRKLQAECIFTRLKRVCASKRTEFPFDKLVSTIPAPKFLQLAMLDGRENLIACDKVYLNQPLKKCTPLLINAWRAGLNYIYCPTDDMPYHRVTFTNDNAIFEFSLVGNNVTFTGKNYSVQSAGQIIEGKEVLKIVPKHVQFLGRYAQWDHAIKFNDVLKIIMEEK